jgi:hypothetical protein
MNKYVCSKCMSSFSRKFNYLRHLNNRKTPCSSVSRESIKNIITHKGKSSESLPKNWEQNKKHQKTESIEDNQHVFYECSKCAKRYGRKDSLLRHMKTSCRGEYLPKITTEISENSENYYQQKNDSESFSNNFPLFVKNSDMTDISEQLKQRDVIIQQQMLEINAIKAKLDNVGIKNFNTQHNIQNIGQVNNFKMVAFGQEDLSFITDEVYKKLIGRGFNSVPMLIKYVHFNKKIPEFHNVFVSNTQNSFTYAYNGGSWNVVSKSEAVKQLIDDGKDILVEKFNELKNELPQSSIKKFTNFIEKQDDDKIVSWMQNEVKMILYNNRKLPMQLKKEMKKLESKPCNK